MSKIETNAVVNEVHGKPNGKDRGYFYVRNGNQAHLQHRQRIIGEVAGCQKEVG